MKEKSYDISSKSKNILFYAVPLLFLLMGILTCFNDTIWVDEAFSVELVKHSFVDIIKLDATDVHPPLYYLIYKLFAMPILIIGGGTESLIKIGKLVSIIPNVLLICIGFTNIKREYGARAAFLFNIMVTGLPPMLLYATEIRMYSWSLLFVSCVFLQAIKIMKGKAGRSDFLLLTFFSAAAAYTHYFACVSAIIIYLELLLTFILNKKWEKLIYTILSGTGVVALYIPWLFVFISQLNVVQESYWIEDVSLKGFILQVLFVFGERRCVTFLFLAVAFVSFINAVVLFIKGCKESILIILGIGVWLGTILAGTILSILIRPIFISRYEIPSVGCLSLALAIALSEIANRKLKRCMTLLLLAACLIVNLVYVKSDYETNRKTEIAVATLDEYIQKDTVILSDDNQIQRVVAMQYPENENVVVGKDLTSLSKAVYSDCNLSRCEENELDKYTEENALLLEREGRLHEIINQSSIETIYLGEYRVASYTFDLYQVKNH